MESSAVSRFCAQCGEPLAEPPDTPVEEREPCPRCGSRNRLTKVEMEDKLELHADLSMKTGSPGEKKPFLEQKAGDSFWRKAGKWMRRNQIIDRRNDRYIETVEDPETGEIVRSVDERLTDHRGYGSAKSKKTPD